MQKAAPSRETPGEGEITQLLLLWRGGDNNALGELFHKLYPQLRNMADVRMRLERSDHTIQPTALVSEVYLRLADGGSMQWQNRGHFLAVASRVMRHFLIDYARTRGSLKGGGTAVRLDLAGLDLPSDVNLVEALAINDLLDHLATFDPRAAKVFEMRVFGGLTHEEAADVLGYTQKTMKRDWRTARAWLIAQLRKGARNDGPTMGAS